MLTTTAPRDGDHYVINGEKASISLAGFSDGCLMFVRTWRGRARDQRCSCYWPRWAMEVRRGALEI